MRKNPLRRADIIVEDVPSPGCGPQDVLIANRASLISAGTEIASVKRNVKDMVVKTLGSQELRDTVRNMLVQDGIQKTLDRVQYETTKWTPLGYSGAGVAIQVGTLVDGIRPGDIVAYGGQGHAEVIRAGKNLCVRVPEGVPESHAAFVAVGGIALQAVRRAEVQVGDRVAVLGLGLVGQLVCQLLQAAGARVLGADVLPQRLELARSLGVEQTFTAGEALPKDIQRATDGLGTDRVMICASTASSQVVEQAVAMARDRARLVVVGMVGLNVPCEEFYRKELDLVISRSYGPGRYDTQYEEQGVDYPISYVRWTEKRNMEEFLRLVQSGKVKLEPLISHRFPLNDAAQAYAALSEHTADCLAVLLTYDDSMPLDGRRVALRSGPAIVPVSKDTANVAVAGCGYFARQFHLPNIKASRLLNLHTLIASSAQNAKEMAARYGAANCTTDFAGALADPAVDAVAIFTRDNAHARMVTAALTAGKHVFCEKPLATTREECEQIAAAARGQDRVCMTGFNRRFAPLVGQVKQILQLCPGPRMVHYRVNAGPLPRENWIYDPHHAAGRIIGEACHFVDLFYDLLRCEPVSVSAQALGEPKSLVHLEDIAATLTFADGSIANLLYVSSGNTKAGKERLEVFTDGTTIESDDFRALKVRGKKNLDVTQRRADKGHEAELDHFAQSILGKTTPAMTHMDGIRATLCCLAIHESVQRGEPVAIELI